MKPLPAARNRKMLLTAFICFILIGCTSVEKRIKTHAQIFATWPPEVQARLREGEIALGYTMQMVEIARGKPDYVKLKQSKEGETTIWRYMQTRPYTQTVPVYDPGIRGTHWVDVTQTTEIEVLRVEFLNGEVASFEELK